MKDLSSRDIAAFGVVGGLCGQSPAFVSECCSQLFSTSQDFKRDRVQVAINNTMTAFEVSFYTKNAGLIDIAKLFDKPLAQNGMAYFNDTGLIDIAKLFDNDNMTNTWMRRLFEAESAHGTLGLWVGMRFAEGTASPFVLLDMAWWSELVAQWAAIVGTQAKEAADRLIAQFEGLPGNFQIRGDGTDIGDFDIIRLTELNMGVASIAATLESHVKAVYGSCNPLWSSTLMDVFGNEPYLEVVPFVNFTADGGTRRGGGVVFKNLPMETTILLASNLAGAEPPKRLEMALKMFGIEMVSNTNVPLLKMKWLVGTEADVQWFFDVLALE